MAMLRGPRLRRRQLPDRHEPRRRPDAGARPLHHHRQLRRHAVERRPRPGAEDRRRADRRPRRSALPLDNIIVDTADTDTGPHCMGTFATAGTHRVGNAVIMAAEEAREVMLDVAAEELEVDAEDLETDGTGFIKLKGSDEKTIHVVDLALAAHFKHGRTISGPRHLPEAERSTRTPRPARWTRLCQAHACTVADVEVDDETGVVEVLRAAQRLRGRPRDQPGDGRAADRGRRVDGHVARAVRDDRALLPVRAITRPATSTNT